MKTLLCIDGEGITLSDDTHIYVLLAASNGAYISNPKGLSSKDCLDFLWKNGQKRTCVGYGLSYDINMMLRDVSGKEDLSKLRRGIAIWIGDYEVEYTFLRSLRIRKKGEEYSIVLWDLLPFFQSSFMLALKAYDIDCSSLIEFGKAERGRFTAEQVDRFMLEYCQAEIAALLILASKLFGYLDECGIFPKRLDGAGSVAAALLTKYGVKKHIHPSPVEVENAARFAYSGGRMETIQYGHYEGDVYHYDINSAYPYAATFLPSLSNGGWIRSTDVNPFGLYKLKWNFKERPFYPFTYRNPDGSIIYPQNGSNWVWGIEYLIAEAAGETEGFVTIEDGYYFEASSNIRPFSFLQDLYDKRKTWKARGIGAEKALKLGINSVYGKLAQQVGYNPETGRRPPFHQLEYAGYITAFTRAMLYHAAIQDPKAIICMATDGIYSTRPLDLQIGNGMGEWEYQRHNSMTVVQSGVYWRDKGENEKAFYRGFDVGTLKREDVLKAWNLKKDTVTCKSTRFVTMALALTAEDYKDKWLKWVTTDRELSITMRNLNTKRVDLTSKNLSKGLVPTVAACNIMYPEFSAEFNMKWGSRSLDIIDTEEKTGII